MLLSFVGEKSIRLLLPRNEMNSLILTPANVNVTRMQVASLLIWALCVLTGNLRAQSEPSLNDTIQYLTNKINALQPITTAGNMAIDTQYNLIKCENGCLILKQVSHTKIGVTKDVTITSIISLPLSKLDPQIRTAKSTTTKDNVYIVYLSTSDAGKEIFIQESYVDRLDPTQTHKDSSYENTFRLNVSELYVPESQIESDANKIANALRHAIELSGSKGDPFATHSQ